MRLTRAIVDRIIELADALRALRATEGIENEKMTDLESMKIHRGDAGERVALREALAELSEEERIELMALNRIGRDNRDSSTAAKRFATFVALPLERGDRLQWVLFKEPNLADSLRKGAAALGL